MAVRLGTMFPQDDDGRVLRSLVIDSRNPANSNASDLAGQRTLPAFVGHGQALLLLQAMMVVKLGGKFTEVYRKRIWARSV